MFATVNIDRQPVLISAYPKSGSTWLTRLLGDALDSPTGGSIASEDGNEVATEGQDRPGPYMVRKGHYRLVDNTTGPLIPSQHRLAWRRRRGEALVMIVRDPRDIAVSGAHYWRQTPEQFLNRMIGGQVARLPAWHIYVEGWMKHRFPVVKYEYLLESTLNALTFVLETLKLDYDAERLLGAVERQSFAARKDNYSGAHQDQHARIMRQGIAGGWREYFTQRMGHMCHMHFGATMARLGYVTDVNWWKALPE